MNTEDILRALYPATWSAINAWERARERVEEHMKSGGVEPSIGGYIEHLHLSQWSDVWIPAVWRTFRDFREDDAGDPGVARDTVKTLERVLPLVIGELEKRIERATESLYAARAAMTLVKQRG